MWPGDVAGGAHGGDAVPGADLLANSDVDGLQVAVELAAAAGAVDDDRAAGVPHPGDRVGAGAGVGLTDLAAVGRVDRGAGAVGDVDASVPAGLATDRVTAGSPLGGHPALGWGHERWSGHAAAS